MSRTVILVLLVAGCAALAGCATVEGLGRDISAGARKVGDML